MADDDRARALARMTDLVLHAREHVRALPMPELRPEEEAVLRLPCFAALGWNAPHCYTPGERALVLALAEHAGLLKRPPVIDLRPGGPARCACLPCFRCGQSLRHAQPVILYGSVYHGQDGQARQGVKDTGRVRCRCGTEQAPGPICPVDHRNEPPAPGKE